jgi:hypothetical protein
MMPPEFISTEPCDVHLIDTSPPCGVIAPWPDHRGQAIHHGARLKHPVDGRAFVAVRLNGYDNENDAWRAVYDDASVSRLCLQIGDKGRAALIGADFDRRDAAILECIRALRGIDDGEAPEFSACIEKLQELRMVAPQPTQGDAPMPWPEARDVGRIGDMSPSASMRIGLDSDNDVYVAVYGDDGGGSVEFCTPGSGGGQSPRVREALIALMVVMEEENATSPSRDWWGRRNRRPTQGEGGA